MRLATLEMIQTLTDSVVVAETLAERIAQGATEADERGDHANARTNLVIARQHRVRALELRGQLAALNHIDAITHSLGR